MPQKRYTEEFKIEAVKQVTENGYTVKSVCERLGVSDYSLYTWIKKYDTNVNFQRTPAKHSSGSDESARIKALEKELKRVTMERDILKEAAVYFAGESKKSTRS